MSVEFSIGGSAPFSTVRFKMEDGEGIITDAGAMLWKTPNVLMSTVGGGIKSTIDRVTNQETLMENLYRATGRGGTLVIAPKDIGVILPLEIGERNYIIQKQAHLARDLNVKMSMHFQKKILTGLFGGEGFIMQKTSGYGMLFLEVDGGVERVVLNKGQRIDVQTSNLIAFESTANIKIEQVPGYMNKLLGGEGLFNTIVEGPGIVYIQTHTTKQQTT